MHLANTIIMNLPLNKLLIQREYFPTWVFLFGSLLCEGHRPALLQLWAGDQTRGFLGQSFDPPRLPPVGVFLAYHLVKNIGKQWKIKWNNEQLDSGARAIEQWWEMSKTLKKCFLNIFFEFDINVYEKQVYNNMMGRSIHILHTCGQKIIDLNIYTLKTHSKLNR